MYSTVNGRFSFKIKLRNAYTVLFQNIYFDRVDKLCKHMQLFLFKLYLFNKLCASHRARG